MIQEIHQSMLNMALRCGEQFRRRYIEGEIVPPSIAVIRGKAVHKANEVNLAAKIKTGRDEPLEVLLDAVEHTYFTEARGGIYLARAEIPEKHKILENGLNQTIGLTRLYHAEVAPEIAPVHVERKFVIDAGFSLPLAGMMDIEQADTIDDIKTSNAKWPETRINEEIQPAFYSFAYEHEFGRRPWFKYHILIPYKGGPQRQLQKWRAEDADYSALRARILILERILRTGLFAPASPGAWWCQEKWCGYWMTCPYVGNALPGRWV
jgi:hypothetical protein